MKEWLLIDGYNVINNWQEFKVLREESLEHAREMLLAAAAEYGAFKGQQVILVFDAQEVPGLAQEENRGGLSLVFTAEGETADSWIERRAYELTKERRKVFVVTSDFAEQIVVLGVGAYRISAREFHEDYLLVKKQIRERSGQIPAKVTRSEVGNRINGDILTKLEYLRRGK